MDIATGEMFLTQQDVESPGALPLRLERTHVSSYRAGHAIRAKPPVDSSTRNSILLTKSCRILMIASLHT